MDNAQKAIMIGVGLFITIIIISVVLLITNLGTSMTDEATSNLGNMSASLQNQLKSQYDNKVVSGAEVKSLFSQYEGNESFLFVFEIDQGTLGEHDETHLYYNDNGFVASAGVGLVKNAGEMFVRFDTTGTNATGISNYAGNLQAGISSAAQYNTYLIYEGSSVIGVYARIRNNNADGTGLKGIQLSGTDI